MEILLIILLVISLAFGAWIAVELSTIKKHVRGPRRSDSKTSSDFPTLLSDRRDHKEFFTSKPNITVFETMENTPNRHAWPTPEESLNKSLREGVEADKAFVDSMTTQAGKAAAKNMRRKAAGEIRITPGQKYTGKHTPTGEEWVILGINVIKNIVCTAGYPPTEARLSDITELKEAGLLSLEELKYRREKYGNDWVN